MIGECGQDIGGSLAAEDRTQEQAALQQERDQRVGQLEEPEAKATTARLLLQNKYPTLLEYQTLEAKDLLASLEPEPDPVLVPLQNLGPGKGVFPRIPFTSACLRLPLRSSTLKTKVGRSLKAEARTQEHAALPQEHDQGVEKIRLPSSATRKSASRSSPHQGLPRI